MLWHEIWHNRQRGVEKVMMLDAHTPTKLVMEAVNQYVSRISYAGFIDRLGGKAQYQDWVMKNGYGYQVKVARLNTIFEKFGIKESITGDLFNINQNQDLLKVIPLLAVAISNKTKIDTKKIENLIASMVILQEVDFQKHLNELIYPI